MKFFLKILLLCLLPIAAQAQIPTPTGNTLIPVSEGNNAWKATLNSLIGGRVGPDSTFVKISGSYLNRRITDGVYKFGTLGVRTADTTGVLNLASAVATKSTVSVIDAVDFLRYKRGNMQAWYIHQKAVSNGDGTTNNVLEITYNLHNGGTVDNSADAVLGISMEPHWIAADGDTVSEWHVFFNDQKGGVHRPMTGFFNYHKPEENSWGFAVDKTYFNGNLANKRAKVSINMTNASGGAYPLEVYKHKNTITTTSASYTRSELDSVTNFVIGNYNTGGESPQLGLSSLMRWNATQDRLAQFYLGLVDMTGAGFDAGTDFVGYYQNSGVFKEAFRVRDNFGYFGIQMTGGNQPTQPLHVNGNARFTGAIYDSNNSPGTSGQILSSTVTGTDWIDPAAGVSGSGASGRVAYWNGASSITSDGNYLWDGTTQSITGKSVLAMGGTFSTSQNMLSVSGTVTSTANSLTHNILNFAPTFANDGTTTGQNYRGINIQQSTATPTAGISTNLLATNTNTSANVSQLYGMYLTVNENTTTSSLSTRHAARFDLNKTSDALDAHNGAALLARVAENSSSGRWTNGIGIDANVSGAVNLYGINGTITTSKGTGNTQYGLLLSNVVSGSGVTTTNAYGVRLLMSEASSGAHGTYYGLHLSSTPVATTNYFLYNNTDFRNYLNGNLAIGVDVTTAKLFVRGAGATSSTYNFITENSAGTDIFLVRDDGMSAFGTAPTSTEKLTVRGATSDNTTKALVVERASGTDILSVRNDGTMAINNAAHTEAVNVNGKVQADQIVLNTSTASNVLTGNIIYTDDATHGGYLTLGDGDRQLAMMPTMIERQVIDWAVDWTTGRKGAFWTVPARFNGWRISKVYIECTAVGSGAGDDILEIEINSVTEGTQTITALTHTLVMDDAIATNDIVTINPTAISATPAKGLNVSFELKKN